MPKVLILDTYYPPVLARHSLVGETYESGLDGLLSLGFGTADFVSNSFRDAGWEAKDVIGNCDPLQKRWQIENVPQAGVVDWLYPAEVVKEQVRLFAPDVLFLQDVSFLPWGVLKEIKSSGVKIAAQVSCAMPAEENVRLCDVIFTSFPHFVSIFESWGVKGVYSRLCFEPSLIPRIKVVKRDLDLVFVGGVCGDDRTGCWSPGTALLEHVAANVPSFCWWGYGLETLKAGSPLAGCYRGEAWGLDQYAIYARAKVAINRHSIHARGCGNNMRCHEAVGMGAMLLTDSSDSYRSPDECVIYTSPEDAVCKAKKSIECELNRRAIAAAGQEKCLLDNTYRIRYAEIAAKLETLLK